MLQRHRVEVISAAEGEGDGDTGIAVFLRNQLAAVAELERGLIRDRLRAGKAQRKLAGRFGGGATPYGYRSCGEGRLEVDDEQAAVVRSIFNRAREGLGPGPVARRLNAEQVPGPTGKPWNRQTVTNILRNPLYAGELHGIKAAQPAIVSRRAWNQAQ
jgi:site-specific DNA recombinase